MGTQKRCIIAGAGPAAAATAAVLAERGWTVDVCEKRCMPEDKETSRNYVLVLHVRGLRALQAAGFDMSTFEHSFQGVSINAASGKLLAQGSNPECWQKFTRPGLARHLILEAQRMHGDSIRFHFGKALVNLDLSQQTAVFAPFTASKESDSADAQALESSTSPEDAKSQNGTPTLKERSFNNGTAATEETVSYDLFIGADGFWSRSRAAFVEQVPGFTAEVDKQASIYKRWFGVGHVKEWQIPGKRLDQPGSMLHFVPGRGDPVGLKLMSIRDEAGRLCKMSIQLRQMMRVVDGTLLGVAAVSLTDVPKDGTYAGGITFYQQYKNHYKTLEDFRKVVDKYTFIPEDCRQSIAEQVLECPWSDSSGWVTCSQLHGPAAILIGDAAHGVSAATGQGSNAALEDSVILRDLLDRGTPLHQLPAAWTKHRLADAHALAFLDKSAKQFGTPGYTLLRLQWVAHMQVHGLLHRILPQLFTAPGFEGLCNARPRLLSYTEYKRCLAADLAVVAGGAVAAAALVAVTAFGLIKAVSNSGSAAQEL